MLDVQRHVNENIRLRNSAAAIIKELDMYNVAIYRKEKEVLLEEMKTRLRATWR